MGDFPLFLGTPEHFQKLNSKFLGFWEMVKLPGRGKPTTEVTGMLGVGIQADTMQGCCEETQFLSPDFHVFSTSLPMSRREHRESLDESQNTKY